MYSHLNAQIIQARQEEIAAGMIHRHDVRDVRAGASSGSGRNRRRARKAVAALAVCAATASAMATSNASARANYGSHVSARQFQREMKALNAVGFVATSCEVDGTLMTNYSTNQSLLLSW